MDFNVQVGKRVVMFSYGSGLTATMFSFRIRESQHPFTLSNIVSVMNVSDKLKQRVEVCIFYHFSIMSLPSMKLGICFDVLRTCMVISILRYMRALSRLETKLNSINTNYCAYLFWTYLIYDFSSSYDILLPVTYIRKSFRVFLVIIIRNKHKF